MNGAPCVIDEAVERPTEVVPASGGADQRVRSQRQGRVGVRRGPRQPTRDPVGSRAGAPTRVSALARACRPRTAGGPGKEWRCSAARLPGDARFAATVLTNDGPARSAERCAIGKRSPGRERRGRSCRSAAPSPPLAAAAADPEVEPGASATHRRRALSATRRVSATLRRLPRRVWATCRRAGIAPDPPRAVHHAVWSPGCGQLAGTGRSLGASRARNDQQWAAGFSGQVQGGAPEDQAPQRSAAA